MHGFARCLGLALLASFLMVDFCINPIGYVICKLARCLGLELLASFSMVDFCINPIGSVIRKFRIFYFY
jgi:hypothetical protein